MVALAVLIILPSTPSPAGVAIVALSLCGGLAAAALRRPTVLRAARQADAESGLRNRLATAVEIFNGEVATQLAPLQLSETARAVADLRPSRAFPRTSSFVRKTGVLALGVFVAAAATVLMTNSHSASTTVPDRTVPDDASAGVIATDGAVSEVAPTAQTALAPRDLQQLRARSATEQAALAQLAEQLRSTAAAHDIGLALQRGDVSSASAQLNDLAQNGDQLSQSAKQELAGALLNASKGTTSLDSKLAAAELATTVAMTRSTYTSARSALQALAAAVLDSQTGTLTEQQLIAQIQQLERDAAAQTGGNGSDCGVLTNDGEFFQDCSATGQAPSSGGMGVVSRGAGQSATAGVGEVGSGRGFATSGLDLDPLGQTPTHLDLPTADVPVDLAPSNAQGNGVPSDQQAPTIAISDATERNVREPGARQSGEPLTDQMERTVVAPARRAAVRDFFTASDVPGP